jgi:uncharacterized membrane protein
MLVVGYPIIPWIAVMALGYCLGSYYDSSIDPTKRKKTFNLIGISAILLFVLLRGYNIYGDPNDFEQFGTLSKNLVSFLNPTKYPPSLLFVLMTLGGTFVLLANSEKWKGKAVDFVCTFGRVPFFFYIIHIYLIHLIAIGLAALTGFSWEKNMVLAAWGIIENPIPGYGFPLWVVYAVWISVILLLYPICKKFDRYKQGNKEKWWLSYF